MRLVTQAYRFELDPRNTVRSALASHAGAARFAFNWGLAEVESRLEAREALVTLALRQGAGATEAEGWAGGLVGPIPWDLPALRRAWNRAKDEVAPWWRENSKEAYSSGLDALARAFKGYFDSRSGARRGRRVGWPKPKCRHAGPRSFRYTTGSFRVVDARHVRLPRIGVVRTKETTFALLDRVGTEARVLSATVAEQAGRWWVSFTCQVERKMRRQLAYKCVWYGSRLVVAQRFYPSSKTCSGCKTVKAKLSLSQRTYCCEHCGLVIDRDRNAAINLASLVEAIGTASGAGTGRNPVPANAQEEEKFMPYGRCSSLNCEDGTGPTGPDKTATAGEQSTAA